MPQEVKERPDPVIGVYKQHIDRPLIRKNLTLTVEERLQQLQKLAEFAEELQRAGKAGRNKPWPILPVCFGR